MSIASVGTTVSVLYTLSGGAMISISASFAVKTSITSIAATHLGVVSGHTTSLAITIATIKGVRMSLSIANEVRARAGGELASVDSKSVCVASDEVRTGGAERHL